MSDGEIYKLLGQSGIAVLALVVLARIVGRIGERMIASIDKLGDKLDAFGASFGGKIDDHTKLDTAAIGGLRQDVAVMDGRIQQFQTDWADQLTPVSRQRYEAHHEVQVEPPRTSTPRQESPSKDRVTGEYSVRPPSERRRTR